MARDGVFEGISLEDPTNIFEITAKLGEGAYGAVYKAMDMRDGGVVAIKMIEIEPGENFAELQKEINILKECTSEYIVAYKGTFQLQGKLWIVMEYCDAGSVMDLMSICEKTLTETQIAVIMKQALQGLHYLHSTMKIHRDIKSGNLLLTHRGECKLADFGVSAELTNTIAKRKTMIGTPYWMAPEVLQSSDYDGKADIWSLAITAYELAVGEPPNSAIHPMRAIFLIPNQPPPTLPNPEKWSTDFHHFMKICLVKDPLKRPSAQQLLTSCDFIVKSPSQSLIADLVRESMEQIEQFRLADSSDRDEGEEGDETGTMNSRGSLESGTSTLRGSVSETLDTGTMVSTGNATLRPGFSVGTIVPKKPSLRGGTDSGTLVATAAGANHKPDYGTMVAAKPSNNARPPSQLETPSNSTISTFDFSTLVIKTDPPPSSSSTSSSSAAASPSMTTTNTTPPPSPTSFKPIPPATPPPRLSFTPTPPPTPPPKRNLPVPPALPPPRRNRDTLPTGQKPTAPMVHMGSARTMKSYRVVDMQTREDEMQMLLDSITIVSQQQPSSERDETLEELGKKLAALQVRPTNPIMGLPPPPPRGPERQLTRSAGLIAKEKKEAQKVEEARGKNTASQPTMRGWQAKKQAPQKSLVDTTNPKSIDLPKELGEVKFPPPGRPPTLSHRINIEGIGTLRAITKDTSLLDLRAEMGHLQLWYTREKERLKRQHDEQVKLIQAELKHKEKQTR